MPISYSSGFAGEVMSNGSVVVENASCLFRSLYLPNLTLNNLQWSFWQHLGLTQNEFTFNPASGSVSSPKNNSER